MCVFCVCSKHSKKIDKDNSKLSLFILQVIQSDLFIPKRWRSPPTFPKKVTKKLSPKAHKLTELPGVHMFSDEK